tara:strand:- start:9 stop:305 length:297 start_codon:yes stop_codon:yes gene_type:complete
MKEINNIGLSECIKSIHPNADFSIYCGEIIWRGKDIKCPNKEELEAEQTKLLAEYDSKQYQRDRIYPPIGDQLDEIYHKGLSEWKKSIKAVKDKHPKP